jgi:hypothetical protein
VFERDGSIKLPMDGKCVDSDAADRVFIGDCASGSATQKFYADKHPDGSDSLTQGTAADAGRCVDSNAGTGPGPAPPPGPKPGPAGAGATVEIPLAALRLGLQGNIHRVGPNFGAASGL